MRSELVAVHVFAQKKISQFYCELFIWLFYMGFTLVLAANLGHCLHREMWQGAPHHHRAHQLYFPMMILIFAVTAKWSMNWINWYLQWWMAVDSLRQVNCENKLRGHSLRISNKNSNFVWLPIFTWFRTWNFWYHLDHASEPLLSVRMRIALRTRTCDAIFVMMKLSPCVMWSCLILWKTNCY